MPDNESYPAIPARVVADEHAMLHDRLAHPSVLTAGYIRGFAASCQGKLADENDLAMMFWPYRVNESYPAARMWCGDVAKSLFQASTFQITAGMQDVVTALYEKSDGLFHLEEPELPALHGFLWLDKPLDVIDRQGRRLTERAFTWGPVTIQARQRIDGALTPVEPLAAIRLCSWNCPDDPDELTDAHPELRGELRALGSLVLSHSLIIPFGERHTYSAGKIRLPADAPGDYRPDSGLAWLHHLWMFMDTEVTVTRRDPIDRHTARRVRRSILHGEVNVVTLRRSHPGEPEGNEPGKVDWSCRWLVQGHYRHLGSYATGHHHAIHNGDCCATCGERITWIHAYVKGPDDLPLKSSRQVYRVSR